MTPSPQSPYTDDWRDWFRPFALRQFAAFLIANRIKLIAALFLSLIAAFPARPLTKTIYYSSIRPLFPRARFTHLPATTHNTFQVYPGDDYTLERGAVPYPAVDPEGILIPVMDSQPRTSARVLVLWDAEADRARFRVDLRSSHFAVGGSPPPMSYNPVTKEFIFSLWSYPGITGRPLIQTELVRVNVDTAEVTGHTIVPGIFQVQDIDPSGKHVVGLQAPWYARVVQPPWAPRGNRYGASPSPITYPVLFNLERDTLHPYKVPAQNAEFLNDQELLLSFRDSSFVYDLVKRRRTREAPTTAVPKP